MRYARAEIDGHARIGLVEDMAVDDSGDRAPRPAPLVGRLRLFPAGTDLLAAAYARLLPPPQSPTVPLADVRLLAPVRAASFRDFVSFEEHVQGASAMLDNPEVAIAAWSEARRSCSATRTP